MTLSLTDTLVPSAATKKLVAEYLAPLNTLRDYQLEAIECCVDRMRKTTEPLLISLPTGSGKSWVIAGLAIVIKKMIRSRTDASKKILVLAPSAELVGQNHQKMVSAGFPASIYMADLRQKDLSEDIVFASPISFDNSVDDIINDAHVFGAVLVDEAHEFTPKIRNTIEKLRAANPYLRVIGLTATPFRGSSGDLQGYIYAKDVYRQSPPLSSRHTRNPPFAELVYEKSAEEMIEEGFLSRPLIGDVEAHYDTKGLIRTATGGNYTEKSNLEVFVDGQEGLTRQIVEDVIKKTEKRKGVIIFAQNRRHAREIVSLLPPEITGFIDSETDKKNVRPQIIQDFKEQKLKYLVNVGTLIRGFDAPHTDAVVMMAHTESDSRLQQSIGRGLRISPETGKTDCLILDYGENLRKDGDLFRARVSLGATGEREGEYSPIEVLCPTCDNVNEFPRAKLPQDVHMNTYGYLVSNAHGGIIGTDAGEPIAGHLGTRCSHYYQDDNGLPIRCGQTWGTIQCDSCGALNSHRAESCNYCDAFLKEANKRLSLIPSRPDGPYSPRLARVVGKFQTLPGTSRSGNPTLRIMARIQELPYFALKRFALNDDEDRGIRAGDPLESNDEATEYTEREELVEPQPVDIQVWLNPTVRHPKAEKAWAAFMDYTAQFTDEDLSVPEDQVRELLMRYAANNPQSFPLIPPGYITYSEQRPTKQVDRTFYEILDYHLQHPYMPEKAVTGEPTITVQPEPISKAS